MKKLAALVIGAGLMINSCKKNIAPEAVNHLDVAIYRDTDVKSSDFERIDNIMKESEHYYTSLLEKSPRFKGKKPEIRISLVGRWESDQASGILDEFLNEIDGIKDINIGFSGKKVLRGKNNKYYWGLANEVPGRYAIVTTALTDKEVFVTLNHEIGHLLGLYHNPLQGSLMSPGITGLLISDAEREIVADTFLSWLSSKGVAMKADAKLNFPEAFDEGEFEDPRLYFTNAKTDYGIAKVFLSGAGGIGVEVWHSDITRPRSKAILSLSKDLRASIGEKMFLSHEAAEHNADGKDTFYSMVLISPDAVIKEGVIISRLLERHSFFTLEQRSAFIQKIADARIADKSLFESFWE